MRKTRAKIILVMRSEYYLLVVHVDKTNRLVWQLVTLSDVPIPGVKDDHCTGMEMACYIRMGR